MAALSGAWYNALQVEFRKPYYKELYQKVREEYRRYVVYPKSADILSAFSLTPLEEVRVVIIGQDPYHEPGQANGLCFSVRKDMEIPPSLVNIYKELHSDLGLPVPDNGDLTPWARQGVLLLNTVLTVRAHAANSHRGIGWEQFTDAAIRAVAAKDGPVAFILWGRQAAEKASLVTNPKHLVITSPHPSPLSASRGFFGSRPFSRVNAYLEENGERPIDWRIPDRGSGQVQ